MPFLSLVFVCTVSTGVAAFLERNDAAHGSVGPFSLVQKRSIGRAKTAVRAMTSKLLETTERATRWEQKLCKKSHAGAGGSREVSVIYSPWMVKTKAQIVYMIKKGTRYQGKFVGSTTRTQMEREFWRKLQEEVRRHVRRSVGGTIEEFGSLEKSSVNTCAKRPSLRMSDVQDLARKSFGISNFVVSRPPCNDAGVLVNCAYGGRCCKRAQTEFIGRYYDTAVAAMALGATRDEAFAVLLHARALAYALQACDPRDHYKGFSSFNDIPYTVQENGNVITGVLSAKDIHVITFPRAYEVLYELYNTMLIERMRSRRTTRIPTHGQMKKLHDAVYYKKLIVRVTTLDRSVDPEVLFPTAADFTAAGLAMFTGTTWSLRTANLIRMSSSEEDAMSPSGEDSVPNPTKARRDGPLSDSKLHPSLRSSAENVQLYAMNTRSWEWVNYPVCNARLQHQQYHPFVFQSQVWSKYQGCCAAECRFMALYGRTFSSQSSNCCSGCNRYNCRANTEESASLLAHMTAIETPSKMNSGAEVMTFTV